MKHNQWTEIDLEKRQQAFFDVVLDQIVEPMDPARGGRAAYKLTANPTENPNRPHKAAGSSPVNHQPKGGR